MDLIVPLKFARRIARGARARVTSLFYSWIEPKVARIFFFLLIRKTNNFGDIKWLGHPIWQNILDLWTIQEVIAEIKPELIIECGTNRGGSSYFYAQLCDLMQFGKVITMDVEKLHALSHPRITYLVGDSCSEESLAVVRTAARECTGPVLVILDSDHSQAHVAKELKAYHSFVTRGSYILVQDGVIDVQDCFKSGRPGPLPAIEDFLREHSEFEVDQARCDRFLITHHPKGWLRRR